MRWRGKIMVRRDHAGGMLLAESREYVVDADDACAAYTAIDQLWRDDGYATNKPWFDEQRLLINTAVDRIS
jgi:hypothetical protein